MNTLRLYPIFCHFWIFSNNMHLNNCNSYNLLIISIKGFVNEFFINTRLKYLINQKITNILWNDRASSKLFTEKKARFW